VILTEFSFKRRGGLVFRVRVAGPEDAPRDGKVLGTVSTPPRLNALFCGDKLVVLRTKDRRTVISAGGHELARVNTPADPRFACDERRLVVEGLSRRSTTLAVVKLPSTARAALVRPALNG
jgi:hypothetical protein